MKSKAKSPIQPYYITGFPCKPHENDGPTTPLLIIPLSNEPYQSRHISSDAVEIVERNIGIGSGAWDTVDPKELVAEVLNMASGKGGLSPRHIKEMGLNEDMTLRLVQPDCADTRKLIRAAGSRARKK